MCFLHCDLVKILLHQLLDFHILEKHVERYCVLVKRRERVDNEKTLYNIVKDIIHVFTSKMSLKSLSEKNGNLMGGQQFKSALFLHGFQAVTLHLQSTLTAHVSASGPTAVAMFHCLACVEPGHLYHSGDM